MGGTRDPDSNSRVLKNTVDRMFDENRPEKDKNKDTKKTNRHENQKYLKICIIRHIDILKGVRC